MVVPSLTREGRVHLRFTTEIRHGQAAVVPQPAERALWVLQKQQPTESFSALGWEVTLAPNEYVVVGGRYDRPGTLGQLFFVRPEESPPRQRLLVIRTARPGAGMMPDPFPTGEDKVSVGRSPPLALQAVLSP